MTLHEANGYTPDLGLTVIARRHRSFASGGRCTHWKYQRELPILQPSTARILCLGDSNVYGLYLPKEQSWPAQLQTLLDTKAPGQYQVINLGFPGTQTFRILASLPDILNTTRPDKIIFLAGANDFLFGTESVDTEDSSWGKRLHRFWIEHIRLGRLMHLVFANSSVSINSGHDDLFTTLEQFKTLSDADAEKSLIAMYQPFLDGTPGLSIEQQSDGYYLLYNDVAIPLESVLRDMKTHSNDIQAMHKIYISPLISLYEKTSLNLQSKTRLTIGDEAIDLNPAAGTDKHKKSTIQKNILAIDLIARQNNIDFILLGYASKQHLYGTANNTFRELAAQSSLTFIDVEPLVSTHCTDTPCTDYFFPDQHPTALGYRIMAERIADYVLSQHANARP